ASVSIASWVMGLAAAVMLTLLYLAADLIVGLPATRTNKL
ncbi:MAG TPA: methylamine utilization protein MauE, partial [Methylophaga sp.]|nr:methylamine utilization protein MauE [Methylophaga sp.]